MYFASSSASILKWLVHRVYSCLIRRLLCCMCAVCMYLTPRACIHVCFVYSVWVGPESGGIAHCGEAWERETAGDKVNDIALTVLHLLY